MLFSIEPPARLLVVLLSTTSLATFFYPSPQTSLLEHILVDTHGAHSSGFADAITPCSNYVSGAQTLGRETAAQWVRVSFHDFVTAHVADGTGGVDASIGFETSSVENSGAFVNDTLGFFRHWSVGNCGGPQIPFRAGRIDATQGGPSGVPAPETSLEETLEFFSGAGFDQVDSIGLTACGHTMGSVHHQRFPTVVGTETVSPNNTLGGVHFDSTADVFDTLVVTEYVNGTGSQGGPLVTSFNVSSRSDLRLYESDNNATMIALTKQGKGFLNTCMTLLQRMLETVPRGVVLSDVVVPMSVKPVNATLDFDKAGNLVFKGYIRTLTAPTSSLASKTIYLTIPGSPPLAITPEAASGRSVFGSTLFYPFTTLLTNSAFFRSFTVVGHGQPQVFPVQTTSFTVPSLTAVSTTSTNTTMLNFTVALAAGHNSFSGRLLRRDISPKIRVQAPVPQTGTLGPAIKTFENVAVKRVGVTAGYRLWSGTVDVGGLATGAVSVAVLDGRGGEVDVAFV